MRRVSWTGVLLAVFITSCSDTTTFKRLDGASAPPLFETGGKALVSLPQDGNYGDTNYVGSGKMTVAATQTAFAPYFGEVEALNTSRLMEEEVEMARSGGYRFLIRPVILHWEDRATAWSGKSDKLTVKITLYDPATGKAVDSVLIEGKSKWATFGGDHPQDMLKRPLTQYAASLFHSASSDTTE